MHKLSINGALAVEPAGEDDWAWPLHPEKYGRSPALESGEIVALAYLAQRQQVYGHFPQHINAALSPLLRSIDDAMAVLQPPKQSQAGVMTVLLLEMHRRQTSYWGWAEGEWLEILCTSTNAFKKAYPQTNSHARHMLVASLYLLKIFDDFRKLGLIDRTALACRIFGRSRVLPAIQRIVDVLRSWGYRRSALKDAQWAVCTMLLANKSPRLEDLTLQLLDKEKRAATVDYRAAAIGVLSRALAGLKIVPHALPHGRGSPTGGNPRTGVDPEWVQWAERWRNTSTLQPSSRIRHFLTLLKAGRWVTATHPGFISPERWTREIAAEWVATVCRMETGQWTQRGKKYIKHWGKPLSAKAKNHHLGSLCAFFRDLQEWEWIPRRFDPRRCFAAPRSLRALISPNPRTIADDIWAKLLWAGLNLTEADLTTSHSCANHYYPLAMVKALTMVWLFCGLRSNEIRRLRVGCTRQQRRETDELPQNICDLAVPVNKTSQAFSKPVDQIVGEAVQAWELQRPQAPAALDEKTGELVDFLFFYRGKRLSPNYINDTLAPILCKKAGMPAEDARGRITSHRARSTIASQLFNAKEPMSLFELQKWLGHKWANSTQYYLDISPTKLAQSYRDAGYFARNVRTINVLIDREVVRNGTASEETWKYYDLGHGYCTYDFFDECKFRMVCAKCSFYLPKSSTQAQLLEGKSNLLRLRQEIPLTDQEQAAVNDGIDAMDKLLQQLADTRTPAGLTLRQLQGATLVQIETKTAGVGAS